MSHKLGKYNDGAATTDWMAAGAGARDHHYVRGGELLLARYGPQALSRTRINIIDTPGTWISPLKPSAPMRVLDGAVMVYDSVGGVQPQSETVWRQANKYHVRGWPSSTRWTAPARDFFRVVQMMTDRRRRTWYRL